MAPPPPANLPLGQRLAALAQTLQFAWFAGHVTLLLATLRYSLSYITFNYASKWAAFSYRVAFLSACVTYGIVVYKAYRARMRTGKQGGVLALATDENVQYLSMFPSFSKNPAARANSYLSHGTGLVVLPPNPSCCYSFRSLLSLPCRYLCALKPSPNSPASTCVSSCWLKGPGFGSLGDDWQVRQGVL